MTMLARVAAVTLGALLAAATVAPLEKAWLHPFAYVPILWALRPGTTRQNVLLLLLCGTVAEAVIFSWIAETITLFSNLPAPVAWLVLGLFSLVYGLNWLAAFGLAQPMRRRLGDLWLVAWPAWLVVVDWLATFLVLFPWQHGVSEYKTTVLWQIVSVTGVWGMSFLVAFVNAVLAEGLYRRAEGRGLPVRWMLGALAVVGLVVAFGAWRLPRVEAELAAGRVVRVLQVQTPHDMLWRMSHHSADAFQFWVDHTKELAPGEADLVVWPEGAVPYDLNRSTAIALLWVGSPGTELEFAL